MQKRTVKRIWWGLALTAVLAIAAVILIPKSEPAVAQGGPPAMGIVCTTDADPNPTFNFTTHSGYVGTPDDNTIFMWGYSEGSNPFQYPGPTLCIDEGDTVTIILHNTLSEDVSIMFPGQDNVLANGEPTQPQFDIGGDLVSLTNVAPANGGSVTYSFVASHPGTFLYQSGTNPAIQVRMGLFGGMIVRPALGPEYVTNRPDSKFNPDTEYLILFSEIDPYLNQAVERGDPFDLNNYRARYWLLNGRGFPDTIAPNFASWLPNQPYGSLALVDPYDTNEFLTDGFTPNPAYNPDYSLDRFINVMSQMQPMHPHGKMSLIVSRDGRPVEGQGGQDLAWENFSVPAGPGETWDGLFYWEDVEKYDPVTNPIPVEIPNLQNYVGGPLFSDSPYLGDKGTRPVGNTSLNQCGEYYIISHSHALHQITSWGVPTTGPVTFMRINPPQPNTCQ
ncbi:MAG: multicopper oxidase domain-containing protein [Aestuariibacter sp.]|nr:multicopper oxidase domain-containing protein [Aestuariibacter sp.]